jgi:hypothetical protein
MIPIFIVLSHLGLVGSNNLARILSSKKRFPVDGAIPVQVRKNFEPKSLYLLEKRIVINQNKKGLKAPLSIYS